MSTKLGRVDFAASRKTVDVDCPELGGSITLRQLSIAQLKLIDKDNLPGQLAQMIVDENGERVYTTPEDEENLAQMSSLLMTRLMTAAAKLNGISQAALDEAVKNLQASPSTDSASA